MGAGLESRKAAVFLDRDGVLNHERSFIVRPDDLVLMPGAAEAVRRLNISGREVVVVSNQSIVARGGCSEADIVRVNDRLHVLLEEQGAHLDALYYCPHHPDPGPGGNAEFAIACECRKPGGGMVLRAMAERNIDLSNSWMVGDTSSDMEMARRLGLRSILVGTGYGGKDGKYSVSPDRVAADLADAVAIILGEGISVFPAGPMC